MLTVHLLGHAYVTLNQSTVPISAKATALIVYLHMEKLPQHRERLADLLWDTPEARKNLRVELARIRSAGLNIFPASQQLLQLEQVGSDMQAWREAALTSMNQGQLTAWLAMLRGLPFTGLEDLGSANFQSWIDQQRWLMTEQIEQQLSRMYWRYERENHAWATRMIAERAEALGLDAPGSTEERPAEADAATGTFRENPASAETFTRPAESPGRIGRAHFEQPYEERELRQALLRSEEQSQLVILHGPAGSGKSHLAERLGRAHDFQIIRAASTYSARLLIATLAQALLGQAAQHAAALEQVLLRPASLEEDMVKVAYSLSQVPRRVMLMIEQPQDAAPEVPALLAFLFSAGGGAGRVYLMLSRQAPGELALLRSLRVSVEPSRYLDLPVMPLSSQSVQRTLETQFPFEPSQRLRSYAAHLTQRSEGNPLHLLSLIEQAPNLENLGKPQLPQALRHTYGLELDRFSPALRGAVEKLSVIHGRFDAELAHAVLAESGSDLRGTEAMLAEGFRQRVLVEAEPEQALDWPACLYAPPPISAEAQYVFRSEGLRITLAAQLPQGLRQEIRRRLMNALSATQPGLAAYYAERANLGDEAARLRGEYLQGLPADSPLRRKPSAAQPTAPLESLPESSNMDIPERLLMRQGYLLSHNGHGLSVLSSNRYSHPSTLTLRFALPSGPLPGSVRLLWRLDMYGGGEELGPALVPFALRLAAAGSHEAQVLLPAGLGSYQEQGRQHRVHSDVALGCWMKHDLPLTFDPDSRTLELSVRAVNLALTLGAVQIGQQNLLLTI